MKKKNILDIKNLSIAFKSDKNMLIAVDNISFSLYQGEIHGIVGESGSGKTATCLSILKLLPFPAGKILNGEIFYNNKDILKMNNQQISNIRGKEIAMIFQEPMTSLNPTLTIKTQLLETIKKHQKISSKKGIEQIITMLKKMDIDNPEIRINEYPHSFSGGMRQRIMIAMALLNNPSILIADEPTTALDVSVQHQIFNIMHSMQNENSDLSIILITHDLALVAQNCTRLSVMYGGQIQETALTTDFFETPYHPYSKALLKSLPYLTEQKQKLEPIRGQVPDLINIPKGCKFWPRCKKQITKCRILEPALYKINDNHFVRCHLYE